MSSSGPFTRNTGPNLQNRQKYNYHHIGVDLIPSFAVAEKQQIKKNGHTVANNVDSRNMQGAGDSTKFYVPHIDRPDGSTIMSH